MKFLNKILILALVFTIPFTGCNTDELQDLNIDPNSANELDWRFLFTQGTAQARENRYVNGRVNLAICGSITQQVSTLELAGDRGHGDKYLYNLDSHNAYQWRLYEGSLKTMAEVIRQTGPEGLNPEMTNLHHMAQVMYILPMSIMTDLYGNVPYSEANKGIDGIFFPAYDSQQSIYMDMLNKLEVAAREIGNGSDEVGDADIIYNGDFSKWRKLANSLMLRLAMRISNVDPGSAESFVRKAVSGGLMESNQDNAILRTDSGPSQWENQNGLSRAMIPDDWGAQHMLGKTFVDILKNTNDPRLSIFSVIGPFGGPFITAPEDQNGMPNGFTNETIKDFVGTTGSVDREATFSRINPLLLDVNDPFLLMSHAESEMLHAEAAVKGWSSEVASDHYNAGVRSSMQMWDVFDSSFSIDDDQVDAYLAANPFDGTEKMIGDQMYVVTFLNWYETFSNFRRTGYPELTPVDFVGNVSNGQIFRRLQYYTQEVANNPNLQSGGTLPDDVLTRMWWDVN